MKQFRPAGVALLVAGLSACDVPTGMPSWETTWITPGEETTVSVVELLPAGLAVNADTSAFVLAIDPVNESFTLAELCALCPAGTATEQKPAFTATVSTSAPLPASVEAAVVESGVIDITLTNGFDFDPIRPGVASDSGSMTITITSGTTEVASMVLDGRTESFPAGTTKNLELQFIPSTITGDFVVDLTIDSPTGDDATMSSSDALGFTLSSDGILVSEATVAVDGVSIEGAEAELDFEDVDIESIREGTIFLDIENPFGVTGDLVITVDPADGPAIVKPVQLEAGTTSTQVDFSEEEMSTLIGTVSQLSISGTLDPGTVTVTPDMAITVGTRLRVTIEVGGDDEETDA